jgi:hypothetical protein
VATLFDETVDNTCTRHSTGERLSCWKRCNVGRLLAPEGLVIERERERKRERERERERDRERLIFCSVRRFAFSFALISM